MRLWEQFKSALGMVWQELKTGKDTCAYLRRLEAGLRRHRDGMTVRERLEQVKFKHATLRSRAKAWDAAHSDPMLIAYYGITPANPHKAVFLKCAEEYEAAQVALFDEQEAIG